MSVFSDLLQNYIHEKKVKVMALAKYCELERSTIINLSMVNGNPCQLNWSSRLLIL